MAFRASISYVYLGGMRGFIQGGVWFYLGGVRGSVAGLFVCVGGAFFTIINEIHCVVTTRIHSNRIKLFL